jgi:hypothetical protein
MPITPDGHPADGFPASGPTGDQDTWERRYHSFRGHANAELQRKEEELKSLRETVDKLQVSVDKLNEPEPVVVPDVTDVDVETFGADMVGFVQRAARKAVADALIPVQAKADAFAATLEEMRGQVGQVEERGQASAEAQFFKDVASAVPDYQAINVNPQWLDWLQQVDPFSGHTRQALLNDARVNYDATRVAAMFNAFKATLAPATVTPPADPATVTTPATPAQSPQGAALERQVSPARSSAQTANPEGGGQPKIWTQKEISDFYGLVARGRMSREDAQRTEADINLAVAQGRVR